MRIPTVKYYFTTFVINYDLIPIIQRIKIEYDKQEYGKDGDAKNSEIEFILHCFSNKRVKIINKVRNSLLDTCNTKLFNTFVLSSFARAVMPENAGLFLCPQDTRHYPYRGVPKGSQSPCKGIDTVKGNAVSYYLFLSLLQMSKTLQSAPAQELAISAEQIIKDLVTSDEISNLRTDLREMLHSYLLAEDDSYPRHKVHASYLTLDMMLQSIETNLIPNQEGRVA